MGGSSLLYVGISTGNPATGDHHAFGTEQLGLTIVVARLQVTAGTNDAPPGEAIRLTEDVPDGSGRSGKSGFLGDFPVGDDIARFQRTEHP